jgi:hypothetical protein
VNSDTARANAEYKGHFFMSGRFSQRNHMVVPDRVGGDEKTEVASFAGLVSRKDIEASCG